MCTADVLARDALVLRTALVVRYMGSGAGHARQYARHWRGSCSGDRRAAQHDQLVREEATSAQDHVVSGDKLEPGTAGVDSQALIGLRVDESNRMPERSMPYGCSDVAWIIVRAGGHEAGMLDLLLHSR